MMTTSDKQRIQRDILNQVAYLRQKFEVNPETADDEFLLSIELPVRGLTINPYSPQPDDVVLIDLD